MDPRPRVLCIAGLDPSGRAGLLADAEAVWKLGGTPLGCATAVTAQPQIGEVTIHPCPPDAVASEIDAVLSDGAVQAVKLGMVAHPDLVRVIMERLTRMGPVPVVVDPVLATSGGTPLLLAGSRRAVYREISRLRPVLTPNLPELAILAGGSQAVDEAEEMRQAEQVLAWGAQAILVKGGHREGDVHDMLICSDGTEHIFHAQRLHTEARGKGCRLAAALACLLGGGMDLVAAVEQARAFLRHHLEAHAA